MNQSKFAFKYLSLAIATMLGAGLTTTTMAQTAPASSATATPESAEIVITGSRIRGVGPVGSNVVAISADDIVESGLATTAELLRSIPQVSNLGLDDSRTNGTQRAISNLFAGTSINLRGLGVEATLSLVNGRRAVPGGEGRSFDLNAIPSIALKQIEVVPDGASAIYGSDAVTGVVNLIPFHSYDGADIRLRSGSAKGLDQSGIDLLAGKTWDRGSAVFAFESFKRSNLQTSSRPTLYDDSLSVSGAIGTSTSAKPGNLVVAGVNRPILDANSDGVLSAAEYAASIASATANRQSNWLGVDALPEQKRNSSYLYLEQKFDSSLKLYAEGFYSKRNFVRLGAAPTSTLSVPTANFYNQSGVATALSINYSFIKDIGNTRSDGYEKVDQTTIGATLDLPHNWLGEVFYTDAQTENWRFAAQQLNNAALTAALADNTSAAFNPFASTKTTQQATIDKLFGYATNHTYIKMKNAAVKADGALFEAPGGTVRLATGLEYLKQSRLSTQTSTASGANNSTVVETVFPEVSRKVQSVYAELFVPIVGKANASPGIKSLSLSLAARYDSYKDTASGASLLDTNTSNPKVGLTWIPMDDLKLRTSYGKSFRAPVVGDYSLGAPTFQAAANYAAISHAASLPLPAGPVAGVAIQGGRPEGGLTPEKATTWSLGGEFSPHTLPGLDLSLTYYNIDYKNQIQVPADQNSLANADYANALVAAGLVIFNPTTAQVSNFLNYGGALTPHIGPPAVLLYGSGSTRVGPQVTPVYVLIDSRSYNGGVLKTSGLDIAARYVWSNSLGTWTLGDTITYVLKYSQSLVAGAPFVDNRNLFNYPLKFSTRGQFGWKNAGINVNLFANYQNAYTNTQVTPNTTISSYTTFDLTAGYDTGEAPANAWLKNISFQLNVQNLGDKLPPYALVNTPAQLFDTQNAGPIGRLVAFTIGKKF